jgi:hypothetical protein
MSSFLSPDQSPPQPIGWVTTMQNWVGYPVGSGQRPPKVEKQWFATFAEAAVCKARWRAQHPEPDCLICVTPAPEPSLKRGKKTVAEPRHRS